MEPPHIRDEAPRDENGVPYNNKRNMGRVEKKSPVGKKNTYSQ